MKRFILLATMFAVVLGVSAQRRMQVWEGNTYMQFFTTDVDSVTFLSFPEGILQECEEIHDTIIKTVTDTIIKTITVRDTVTLTVRDTITKTVTVHDTITQIVKDTVYIQYCPDTVSDKPLAGVFSVSADKQVSFAKGNLQYQASTKTWRFAENQYDYIGSDNANISDTYSGWIDLFGWSGSTGSAKWGISTSTSTSDYSGDFVDWGTNTIGTDAPNTWRTLTIDEWQYLFMHTRWTMAKVNGTLGFMLLPADFVAPAGLTVSVLGDGNMSDTYKNFNESDYSSNVYTVSQFSQLETAGVVFLPCAGYRYGSSVYDVGSDGYYWSATPYVTDYARYVYFYSTSAYTYYWNYRYYGQSVRLVQDLK